MRFLINTAIWFSTLALVSGPSLVAALPSSTEIDKYLIVGMTGVANPAVDIQQNELGADQQVLSTADPNTRDVFKPGERWPAPGATQDPPPPPADPIFEGIDWSGNVAITAAQGTFSMSNTKVYADLGVQCADPNTSCIGSVSNSNYFPDQSLISTGQLSAGVGVSEFDPAALLAELGDWKTFIENAASEGSITSNIENQSDPGGDPFISTFTAAMDTNNDGVIIVDIWIDSGNSDFKVNNSDWIIQVPEDKLVIFRVQGKSNMLVDNSSILLDFGGTDPVDQLGAIFYKGDAELESQGGSSSDTVFGFNNVVLNGIGIWDLVTVGATGNTKININNGQGCAQFISSIVDMDDVRWNKCSLSFSQVPDTPGGDVPEPLSVLLLGGGLMVLGAYRKVKRTRKNSELL